MAAEGRHAPVVLVLLVLVLLVQVVQNYLGARCGLAVVWVLRFKRCWMFRIPLKGFRAAGVGAGGGAAAAAAVTASAMPFRWASSFQVIFHAAGSDMLSSNVTTYNLQSDVVVFPGAASSRDMASDFH